MGKRLCWGLATAVFSFFPLFLLFNRLQAGSAPAVLIDAILVDGIASGEPDEAVRLRNVGGTAVDLSGWQLSDGEATAVLPAGVVLPSGAALWLTRNGTAFAAQFGFAPDYELVDSSAAIPNLSGSWSGLANSGDQVLLRNDASTLIDCVPFVGNYDGECGGLWSGAPVQPYTVSSVFGSEGQILYRKRDAQTSAVLPDTNTAVDWAQERSDPLNGRKVQYPGWDLDAYFQPFAVTQTAVLTIAVAPDNAYHAIARHIAAAKSSIQIETHTFENVAIAQALVQARQRGVAVTVLLEGAPAGGLPDAEKYNCQLIEAAGGACWFMISDDASNIQDRYRFLHAKFIVIDNKRVLISSENMSPNSLPSDNKADGTWGRRGVVLITNAPGVIAHVQDVFAHDWDVANHHDLFRWQAGHDKYGAPPPGFVPILETGGITYTVRYPQPVAFKGSMAFEVVQSPENSLYPDGGLLGLVNRAGAGDTVLVQQLTERPYWGSSSSNPSADPNLRLTAYLAAARRGARVRLLLDSLFDDGGNVSNAATCAYVVQVAAQEGLDFDCRLGNPAGLGIHNKMVLVQVDGKGYVHAGSINGTEQSSKGNRELALQVQSNGAYTYLAEMFHTDWPKHIFLPLLLRDYRGPASTILISEVLYNPNGSDDAEFIELVNPTGTAVDLSGYSLSDAVLRTDFEDLRHFPAGTVLPPGGVLVVATTATGFWAEFNQNPDFEILPTDTAVADMIDNGAWGDPATHLQLGNSGDEVILRDSAGRIVDVLAYGTGSFPGLVSCALVSAPHHSLERFPYWRDTDSCPQDFRDWAFPSPGVLP